jgi:hypothetical protein
MARPQNPYAGTYAPSRMSLSKSDLVKGLKSIKIKAPNRKYSEQGYKTALPKEGNEQK